MYSTVTVFEIYIKVELYTKFFFFSTNHVLVQSPTILMNAASVSPSPIACFSAVNPPGLVGGPRRVIRHTGR